MFETRPKQVRARGEYIKKTVTGLWSFPLFDFLYLANKICVATHKRHAKFFFFLFNFNQPMHDSVDFFLFMPRDTSVHTRVALVDDTNFHGSWKRKAAVTRSAEK